MLQITKLQNCIFEIATERLCKFIIFQVTNQGHKLSSAQFARTDQKT
jgi:hypothetical protein